MMPPPVLRHILNSIAPYGPGRTLFVCHHCGEYGQFDELLGQECPNLSGVVASDDRLAYSQQRTAY